MTYPNALVMSYLQAAGQLTPEWRMKCEAALAQGVQRLYSFEVSGGGFDWYGKAPANTVLSAYGLMEFHDINAVYPIDTAILARTRAYLASKQQSDGRWTMDRNAYSWSAVRDDLTITAFVTWAILETGVAEPRGVAYLESHLGDAKNPYTLALIANALVKANSPRAAEVIARLDGPGTADATALAVLAMARKGSAKLDEESTRLLRLRDPQGGWGTTSATIVAIKALLAGKAAIPERPMPVAIRVNGRAFKADAISAQNHDVVQQIDVTDALHEGANEIEIECDARISAQVAARCWIPWSLVPETEQESPISIETKFDKTKLARNDRMRCDVTLRYTGPGAFMVIADLGIPPGFAVETEAFDKLVAAKRIDKYAVSGRQVTLYFGAIKKDEEITFSYDLRAKYPVVAKSPRAHAYEYYSPGKYAMAKPQSVEVSE